MTRDIGIKNGIDIGIGIGIVYSEWSMGQRRWPW